MSLMICRGFFLQASISVRETRLRALNSANLSPFIVSGVDHQHTAFVSAVIRNRFNQHAGHRTLRGRQKIDFTDVFSLRSTFSTKRSKLVRLGTTEVLKRKTTLFRTLNAQQNCARQIHVENHSLRVKGEVTDGGEVVDVGIALAQGIRFRGVP